MAVETLYDITERKYPNKRGDSFRSTQVFKCPTCKALTNRVIMGGWPGYGVRTICPHASSEWHHLIMNYVEVFGRSCPEVARRLKFHKWRVTNDLVGNPDTSVTQEVHHERAYTGNQMATHTIHMHTLLDGRR